MPAVESSRKAEIQAVKMGRARSAPLTFTTLRKFPEWVQNELESKRIPRSPMEAGR